MFEDTSSDIFGNIKEPEPLARFGGVQGGAIGKFINVFLNLLIIGAGIYAVINLVLAGYGFMSAGDDPKKVAAASSKIWQTLLGLAISAGAFVLAAIFGRILFGSYDALLNPKLILP
jgi:hypothetical protein